MYCIRTIVLCQGNLSKIRLGKVGIWCYRPLEEVFDKTGDMLFLCFVGLDVAGMLEVIMLWVWPNMLEDKERVEL